MKAKLVMALACSLLAFNAAASVAPPGSERRLGFLEDAVGQYPRQTGLWDHALLHRRLSTLLGKRLPFFRSNMWNTTTISRQGHLVFATGSRRPLAGHDGAIFVADLRSDTLWVWVMISGRLFEYRERPAQPELPAEVALFLENWRAATRSAGMPAASYR
jgi:hypothetical protein